LTGGAYTVSFDAQGGSPEPAEQTVANGGKAAEPSPAPVKAGYVLEGWHADAAHTSRWDFAVNTVTDNLTLSAKWEAVPAGSFGVSFDTAGGSEAPSQTVASGGKAAEPSPAPVKAGHALEGWHADAAYTNRWDFAVDTVTDTITLYAKWTSVTFTVSFDAQGGSPEPAEQTAASGGKAAAPSPAPAKVGHVLEGWYADAAYTTRWDFSVNTVTETITLRAKWTPITFKVSFDAQGGSPEPAEQTVAGGGKATAPSPVPVKDGRALEGWYADTAYTSRWDFSVNTVTANIALRAKWTAVPAGSFAAAFDTAGGGAVESQTVAGGGKATEPSPAPAKAGRTLEGWYADAAYTTRWDFAVNTVAKSVTLYAKWTPVTFTVSFDAHDGTPAPAAQTAASGGKAAAPSPAPTKAGRILEGWYADAAYTTRWDFAVNTVAKSVTLYAKWTPAAFTVSFDAHEGSPAPAAQTAAGGGKAAAPSPAPTKAGRTLEGWYTEAAYTTRWDFAVNTAAKNITLHAKWTAAFVPVTNISGVPKQGRQGIPVSLEGAAAEPGGATHKTISWAVKDGGGTGVTTETAATGSFAPSAPGSLVLTARIASGAAEGTPYTQDFTIVIAPPFAAVADIAPASLNWTTGAQLDLNAQAAVEPSGASYKTIGWSVKDPGDTGLATGAVETGVFTPAAKGTATLTATIANGKAEEGADRDFVKDIALTIIKPVERVDNVPPTGTVGQAVSLAAAAAYPADASYKTIAWAVKDGGTAGVAIGAISGNSFTPAAQGTVTLTAAIANGSAIGTDFVQEYSVTITAVSGESPVDVGLGKDTSIALRGKDGAILSRDAVIQAGLNENYYVSINGSGYAEVVWYLNGTKQTVTDTMIYLNTSTARTIKLSVEGKKDGKLESSGTYTFKVGN
jgi:uncharacterized repeat protein (TIGR02543 family)